MLRKKSKKVRHLICDTDLFEKGPLPADVVKAVEDVWAQVKAEAPKYHF